MHRNPRFAALLVLCVNLVACWCDVFAQESTSTTSPAEQAGASSAVAPVVIDGIPLFSVRGVAAFPAERRAHEIANRIEALAANRSIPTDSLRLSETPNSTDILAGDRRIMSVVDADATVEGVPRQVLGQVYLQRIREAIEAFRHERTTAAMTRNALYALAATILFINGVFFGWRGLRRIHAVLSERYRDRIHGVGIQSFEIIRREHLLRVLLGLDSLVTLLLLLTAVYLYVHFVLSLFPRTRGVANTLFSLVSNPVQTLGRGLLLIIPDLVFLAVLAVITRYVLVLIRLFFTAIEAGTITLREFDPSWAKPTYRLVRVGVIAFALVVAYPYIPGSESDAFKGVSLFVGVLFSLGSTSLIGNIIAGYTLTYRRTFKPGDRVKIGSYTGFVEQSRVLATHLRTPKNEIVIVPNSKIINEEVLNYSTLAEQDGLILHTTVGVGYEAPWRQVEAMLLAAAAQTPGILREPEPFVLQKMLGDFAVTYELNGYCNQPRSMGKVYTRLHQNILDLFNEYGVQIMTPAYEGDPENPKVVPRSKWYAAPARAQDDTSFPKVS